MSANCPVRGRGTLQSFLLADSVPMSTPYQFVYHLDRKGALFTHLLKNTVSLSFNNPWSEGNGQ